MNDFKKQVKEANELFSKASKKLDEAVKKARTDGVTWNEIAKEVGLTRQGAWARWASEDKSKGI